MAIFKFTLRNKEIQQIGYDKCDNCGFMLPCLFVPSDVSQGSRLCKGCLRSAFDSFQRINDKEKRSAPL